MEKVILAIDAGGTSTRYNLYNKEKKVLYSLKMGSGSPAVNVNATKDIFNSISEIYNNVIKDVYKLAGIVIGMSGFALVNEEKYKKELEDAFNTTIILENDAVLALNSVLGLDDDKGVVIISGTGAIVMATNGKDIYSCNGWGELLTERGSAYACVRDFVCDMVVSMEEKGELTPFQNKFLEYMGFSDIEEFKMLFYRHTKSEVAKYCMFFIEEANKGNKAAKAYLYKMGESFANDCINASKHVNLGKSFVLGFRGGFIKLSIDIRQGVIDTLKNKDYSVIINDLDSEPICGAYYQAKKKGLF